MTSEVSRNGSFEGDQDNKAGVLKPVYSRSDPAHPSAFQAQDGNGDTECPSREARPQGDSAEPSLGRGGQLFL